AAIFTVPGRNRPLFLPPGTYLVSNLRLPFGAPLSVIPGATVLSYGGEGHLLFGEGVDRVALEGLVLDGANRTLGDYTPGLVHFSTAGRLLIQDCEIRGSTKSALVLDRVAGRVTANRLVGAAEAGIHANESAGLEISSNTVSDCADNGILVWRWQAGEDGTIVTNNRIERIGNRSGGSGQYGNGVNVFRAGSVIVSGNRISDCAYSAVRINAAANTQIMANNCSRLGEIAIFVEFAYDGAVVANNVIADAASGISMTNLREGGRLAACTGNLVRNLNRRPGEENGGVGIAAEADTAITGNVVDDAGLVGLLLGWGPYLRNVSANGNVIRRAGIGIGVSVADGAGTAAITGNIISDVEKGAILAMEWQKIVSGDLIGGGAEAYPHLTIAANSAG
ncbi:MAG: TIGR03808 family TAT-translocated repetitive protein, partial [Hyphomicrobiales bacterium]|nr:TIGR03808 family TAT-translocated repetitive protein [Hyphomicrobiales bacterium]